MNEEIQKPILMQGIALNQPLAMVHWFEVPGRCDAPAFCQLAKQINGWVMDTEANIISTQVLIVGETLTAFVTYRPKPLPAEELN